MTGILGLRCDRGMNVKLMFFQVAQQYRGLGFILRKHPQGFSATNPKQLLIVEDEARMADLLRKGLAEAGLP